MRYDLIRVESPLGAVVVATTPAGVIAAEFVESRNPDDWRFVRGLDRPQFEWSNAGRDVAERLTSYFEGDLQALDQVRAVADGSPFQRRVWTALREIPPAETVTYGRLAEIVGRPGAARAVGRANATNQVAVIVPCHRVVGADGTLTGYAGGLDLKRRLLEQHQASSLRRRATTAAASV